MSSNREVLEVVTEEIREAIRVKGVLHPNDVFDLAYHAGQALGLDVDTFEGESK